MSLYTKYRPKDWDSVVSQDYITTILRNSLTSGRVSHAYLFHGSRGTGKTTSARILAKALNCTSPQNGNPCHVCTNCQAFDSETMLDIIEIDGASNNGVENVRELIERARFEPNQGKYKIYIIDEVHMLSTGAFNALLKILEEPPKHVKFILATTEIDKVPETIRSRTLRFDFRKITLENIISRLEYVAESEQIKAEPEARKIIAKAARGGLRDALTLFEQNIIDGEVTAEHVRHTLSLVEEDLIEKCGNALFSSDIKEVGEIIETLKERHVQVRSFFDQMMYHLRDQMVENLSNANFRTYSDILSYFESAYSRIRSFPDGMMLLEITLYRITKREESSTVSSLPLGETQKTRPEKKEREIPEQKKEAPKIQNIIEHTPKNLTPTAQEDKKEETSHFSYPTLINKLKETHPGLTVDMKMARFEVREKKLTLIFTKKWNHDRVNVPAMKNAISEACSNLFTGDWSVSCSLQATNSDLASDADGVF